MPSARLLAALLLAVAGCSGADRSSPAARESTPASTPGATTGASRAAAAAAVANAIAASPAGADSILKAAGYTAESFQQLIYEIAADSGMSAEYAAARK